MICKHYTSLTSNLRVGDTADGSDSILEVETNHDKWRQANQTEQGNYQMKIDSVHFLS
jgi:hypothetical protein